MFITKTQATERSYDLAKTAMSIDPALLKARIKCLTQPERKLLALAMKVWKRPDAIKGKEKAFYGAVYRRISMVLNGKIQRNPLSARRLFKTSAPLFKTITKAREAYLKNLKGQYPLNEAEKRSWAVKVLVDQVRLDPKNEAKLVELRGKLESSDPHEYDLSYAITEYVGSEDESKEKAFERLTNALRAFSKVTRNLDEVESRAAEAGKNAQLFDLPTQRGKPFESEIKAARLKNLSDYKERWGVLKTFYEKYLALPLDKQQLEEFKLVLGKRFLPNKNYSEFGILDTAVERCLAGELSVYTFKNMIQSYADKAQRKMDMYQVKIDRLNPPKYDRKKEILYLWDRYTRLLGRLDISIDAFRNLHGYYKTEKDLSVRDPQRFNELADEDLNLEALYDNKELLRDHLEKLCKRFEDDVQTNQYVSKGEVLFKGKENADEIMWYSGNPAPALKAKAFRFAQMEKILRGE